MALLLLLLLPFVEIYVLIQVGSRIGFVNTVFALLAIGVLGGGLAKAQGRQIFQSLQSSLAQGQAPATRILHGFLVFLAGVLFVIPGFVTDVFGILLLLPGTRHLIAFYLSRQLEKKLRAGQFRVFTAGAGWARRTSQSAHSSSANAEEAFTRDVSPKVIDVTPISTSSRSEENDSRKD